MAQRPLSPDVATTTPFLASESTGEHSPQPNPPSRWALTIRARILRFLGRFSFWLNTFPEPSAPAPSFYSSFTATALDVTNGRSTDSATLELAFYVPPDYEREAQRGHRYPVVINYHGGGFTMGQTTDDARWAAMVVHELSAVVVSVAYRLAPEHPFPTAVEDCVCALLHLSANADVLGIDASKMTLGGFSAGGNLAFSVPLRLQSHLRTLADERGGQDLPPNPHIVSIVAWYPSTDNRISRAQRRAACSQPSKALPPVLTNLFDASYFPDPENVASPYASPAAATDEDLKTALPHYIAMYLCEWDMLLQEGSDFAARLEGLGKRVKCEVVKERAHAFDKNPWPFSLDSKVQVYYAQACKWLCEVYEDM